MGVVMDEDEERVRIPRGVLQEGLESGLRLGIQLQDVPLRPLLGHVLLLQAQLQQNPCDTAETCR